MLNQEIVNKLAKVREDSVSALAAIGGEMKNDAMQVAVAAGKSRWSRTKYVASFPAEVRDLASKAMNCHTFWNWCSAAKLNMNLAGRVSGAVVQVVCKTYLNTPKGETLKAIIEPFALSGRERTTAVDDMLQSLGNDDLQKLADKRIENRAKAHDVGANGRRFTALLKGELEPSTLANALHAEGVNVNLLLEVGKVMIKLAKLEQAGENESTEVPQEATVAAA